MNRRVNSDHGMPMIPLSQHAHQVLLALGALGQQPFTTGDLASIGIDARRLAELMEHGDIARERRGVYRMTPLPHDQADALERARVITAAVPSAVVSHESAAFLLNLSHLRTLRAFRDPLALTITTPSGMHKGQLGYRAVSATIPSWQIANVDGIPVTCLTRTAVDIARFSTLGGALAAFDAASRQMITDWTAEGVDIRVAVKDLELRDRAARELQRVIAGMRRWPGVGLARLALRHFNPASESPLESSSRAVIIQAHLPEPTIGVPIFVDGSNYWLDFLWERQRMIGEADGALKYASGDPQVLLAEKRREDALREAGFTIVRWGWSEGVSHPDRLIRKLARHL